jgi:uncharacterized protein (UPF0210 family)
MKIRSVTYFNNPGSIITDEFLLKCESFIRGVKDRFQIIDLEVQTIRFASAPFGFLLEELSQDQMIAYAQQLEKELSDLGYDYISLGPALPDIFDSYRLIPDLIQNTEKTFFSGLLTNPDKGLFLPSVRACGEIIHKLSHLDPNGFSNLYFAALGNVPPGGPFFPAAYHDHGEPMFSIAVEAADLAVKAFSGSDSFINAQQELNQQMELNGDSLTRVSLRLAKDIGVEFGGIDYSLAPFPEDDQSLGTALQEVGITAVGDHGSLAAATFLANCIDRADFVRTGFSGLMLPILEDSVLAKRAAEGTLGIKDMLLYSAVCGTGLDTVPLPGDTSPGQLSALLFDLGALSLRLNKPLTARLMPIPGKKAGDPTTFDFPFFKNSRVMELQADELGGYFKGDGYLDIQKRQSE